MTSNHRHHMTYTFRPLTIQDLTCLHQWFQEPVIHQMYARNQTWSLNDIKKKYQPRIMGKENIPSFIIELNNQPIGFIQYYCLKEHLPEGIINITNPLFNQYNPSEIVGIDFLLPTKQIVVWGLAR